MVDHLKASGAGNHWISRAWSIGAKIPVWISEIPRCWNSIFPRCSFFPTYPVVEQYFLRHSLTRISRNAANHMKWSIKHFIDTIQQVQPSCLGHLTLNEIGVDCVTAMDVKWNRKFPEFPIIRKNGKPPEVDRMDLPGKTVPFDSRPNISEFLPKWITTQVTLSKLQGFNVCGLFYFEIKCSPNKILNSCLARKHHFSSCKPLIFSYSVFISKYIIFFRRFFF